MGTFKHSASSHNSDISTINEMSPVITNITICPLSNGYKITVSEFFRLTTLVADTTGDIIIKVLTLRF